LPVVWYGCETWSATSRQEHRLRVLENRILRKMFWSKWDEVTWKWRGLNNGELYDVYSSPNILVFRVIKSRRMKLLGYAGRMGKRCDTYRILWGKLRERDDLEDPILNGKI
jgi:hypothetical protein